MLNISVYIYRVTCYSCFSQLSRLVLLYSLYFSVFLLLLKYVKLDNSFCYQVLVEACMFLIIFIFIILSMFMCILHFCRIYRKKKPSVIGIPKVYLGPCTVFTETVVRRCPVKKVFLKISQNSQENTCARASFLGKPAALSKERL